MQPDPGLFLTGIRREILRIAESGNVTNVVDVLTLKRVAEALTSWAARSEALADDLEALCTRQSALLEQISAKISALGAAGPRDAGGVSVPGRVTGLTERALPEIATYDRNAAALQAGLRHLEDLAAGDRTALSAYYLAAADIEAAARDALARECALVTERERQRAPTHDEAGRDTPTAEALTRYLRQRGVGGPDITVRSVTPHRGVNTKDILFLKLADAGDWPADVIMRRLRAFTVNQRVSMSYEYALQTRLADKGFPVARPLLVEEGGALSQPFVIMETKPGGLKPASTLGVSGRQVMEDIAAVLARVHQFDYVATARAEELSLTAPGRIRRYVEQDFALWRRSQIEPLATLDAAFDWLFSEVTSLSEISVLVHGDYDLRNILIDGDKVSAVLDWERSHVGHPAEDLAYCRTDVERVMPWSDFLAIYRAHGGAEVTDRELEFFAIASQVLRLVSINRAFFGYSQGEHSDFLLGSAIYLERQPIVETLHRLLTAAEAR